MAALVADLISEESARGSEPARGAVTILAAAWLHAAPTEDWPGDRLLRAGIPIQVVTLVEKVDRAGHTWVVPSAARADRDAALIRYAVLDHAHRAGHRIGYWHWGPSSGDAHAQLAEAFGWPALPSGHAAADLSTLTVPPPAGHWCGPARDLQRSPDPAVLPWLLAGRAAVGHDADHGCCRVALHSATWHLLTTPGFADDPAVRTVVERWWDSADGWEATVAVTSVGVRADEVDPMALESRFADDRPGVAGAAIAAIDRREADHPMATAAELGHLGAIVARHDRNWRFARATAMRRLRRLGTPEAITTLWSAGIPIPPGWRGDRAWLRDPQAAATIPALIDRLGDRYTADAAAFALGELRAREAVTALCATIDAVGHPMCHLEALGKLGDPAAAPTVARLAREHPAADIRDHALRALERIGAHPLAGDLMIVTAIEAADNPHPAVRDRAGRLLIRHPDPHATTVLIRLCDSPHAARAADALAVIGDRTAGPALWALFVRTDSRRARCAAGRAMARLGTSGTLYYPDAGPGLRRA